MTHLSNNQNSLDEILGNLTLIVGLAHVKAAQGEITTDEASKRTHTELATAKSAINKTIMECLPKSYLITPWKNIKDLPDEQYKVGYNQAIDDMTQQLIKKYGGDDA